MGTGIPASLHILAIGRRVSPMRPQVLMRQSYAMQENIVLPGDTNAHDTLFGGLLMKHIDETAAISARRHCHGSVVTASNDGVHFHRPVQRDDIVRLESWVCSVGRTSMEVFVKITTENCTDGQRHVAAISFLTFVALDAEGRPAEVPDVAPESAEEVLVYRERGIRREARLKKRDETDDLIHALAAIA
jgi:acyl-CoA hydrolase